VKVLGTRGGAMALGQVSTIYRDGPLRSGALAGVTLARSCDRFQRVCTCCLPRGRWVHVRPDDLPRRERPSWPGAGFRHALPVRTGFGPWRCAGGCNLCPFPWPGFPGVRTVARSPAVQAALRRADATVPTRRGKRGGYRPERFDRDASPRPMQIAPQRLGRCRQPRSSTFG